MPSTIARVYGTDFYRRHADNAASARMTAHRIRARANMREWLKRAKASLEAGELTTAQAQFTKAVECAGGVF